MSLNATALNEFASDAGAPVGLPWWATVVIAVGSVLCGVAIALVVVALLCRNNNNNNDDDKANDHNDPKLVPVYNELPANREGGFRSEPSTYNELPLNGNDGYEELSLRAPPTVGGYQPGLVNNNNNNNDMYPSDVLNAARATNQSTNYQTLAMNDEKGYELLELNSARPSNYQTGDLYQAGTPVSSHYGQATHAELDKHVGTSYESFRY